MPLYEGECLECGNMFEEFLRLSEYESQGLICPICDKSARTVISAVPTVGPMPSKPLNIKQIGQSFTSNGEMRRYFEKHPDRVLADPGSNTWKNHVDYARGKADTVAKKHGYRDFADRRSSVKKEKVRKAALGEK